ncbi:glucosaminidase domain-containing protein [Mucilaginibacter sp. HMF5004]|uniref:glucosaminidase domain-containing protein n=1 Tax=Mucilaginibacter rivuli TaxID=2857527 RepID=UPI001C5FD0C0|nr:glucosaminidase domain-containing protein [Mucilaginibacter rivuli]MBW4890400.1 glucosaminidase domain-containing protein [Mucilaginibacter rivuli]
MRKLALGLFLVTALSSCLTHKKATTSKPASHGSSPGISNKDARRNNEEVQKTVTKNGVTYVTYTSDSYIQRFKTIAIQEMNTYGIPASITLAQGLFESGNGNSELARVANNHFGVKCSSNWTGKSYYKNDDMVNDCFRVYSNPEDSYRDHSNFLKKKNYAALFELDKNDYKGWANGLKKAGYATNPNYPNLLINIIEKYHLDQYDRPEGSEAQKTKREDKVFAQITTNMGKDIKDSIVNVTPVNKLYTVKQGDTLYNISKRFGLTVDELKALNRMGDNNIKLGQQLVIAK